MLNINLIYFYSYEGRKLVDEEYGSLQTALERACQLFKEREDIDHPDHARETIINEKTFRDALKEYLRQRGQVKRARNEKEAAHLAPHGDDENRRRTNINPI